MWEDRETKGGNGSTALKVRTVSVTTLAAVLSLMRITCSLFHLSFPHLFYSSSLSLHCSHSGYCNLTASLPPSLFTPPPTLFLSGVSAIIFVASISEYDQCLYEDCATNRTVSRAQHMDLQSLPPVVSCPVLSHHALYAPPPPLAHCQEEMLGECL
jgi:hypothetical protein